MKRRAALLSVAVVLLALVPMGAAQGPVAAFPGWIPFNADSPEGVAVDKVGNVYVSMAVGSGAAQHDELWKFTPSGEKSVLTQFSGPGAGRVGLAVDDTGNVYMARSMSGPGPGVYKVDQDGQAALVPGTHQILFADGLAFDQRGNLYITEMTSFEGEVGGCFPAGEGRIWRVPKRGAAEIWLRHPLLDGNCRAGIGLAVGANGIQFYLGDLYLINTEQGTIVRVPVRPDGTPGTPEVWAAVQSVPGTPFEALGIPAMGDGFALDVHGNAYVAVVSQAALVRINARDKSQETIAMLLFDPTAPLFAPLDYPTSLAFGTGKGGRESLFLVNMGGLSNYLGDQAPGTSLMKFDVGIAGLPLR